MTQNKKCKDRVADELRDEIATIRTLWTAYQNGDEETEDGTFNEHGLAFVYVQAGTFDDQDEGYFRYQISWGGPSDEFRFFCDAAGSCHRIEYWFMDWYDGACIELTGEDEALMMEIFGFFDEIGCVQAELEKAREY